MQAIAKRAGGCSPQSPIGGDDKKVQNDVAGRDEQANERQSQETIEPVDCFHR